MLKKTTLAAVNIAISSSVVFFYYNRVRCSRASQHLSYSSPCESCLSILVWPSRITLFFFCRYNCYLRNMELHVRIYLLSSFSSSSRMVLSFLSEKKDSHTTFEPQLMIVTCGPAKIKIDYTGRKEVWE